MRISRFILYLILLPFALFLFLLIYGTLSDYRPPPEQTVAQTKNAQALTDSTFKLMIWNIGYGGLGAGMDFFYDGGKGVRDELTSVEDNLDGIIATIESIGPRDFHLLQEVDIRSRRSYRINQRNRLKRRFPGYEFTTGINYDVFFVPLPLLKPYGRVYSGLLTMSPHQARRSVRHAFPGNYNWPLGVFMLDRCFLVNRYRHESGKELLVINTHLSAYDGGSLKQIQMEYMRNYLLSEYRLGNYIIAGGDWNQTPAGFTPHFNRNIFDTLQLSYVEADYLPGDWAWLYDPAVPTNRRVDIPYNAAESRTTLIDYYLISPNLEAVEVRGIDLDFAHSDHQPVLATIRIKP